MAISRQQKEEILEKLVKKFADSKSIVFAENKGLSVSEITDLRNKLRESGSEYKIAKKTLLKRALVENKLDVDEDSFKGPIGAIFAFEDELSSIQVAYKFAKGNKNLVLHGGIFEGRVVDASQVKELALIPSKDVLIAKLLGTINAPISNFVGVGNSVISSFVRACSEIAKKGE